jgi:hypothetical protein
MSFLMGGALGYVLGARAGQQRYEQIKTKSQQLWQSDPVQTKVTEATDVVKAKAPVVTEKVTEAAKHAGEAAKSKFSSDDTTSTGSDSSTYTTSSGTSTSPNASTSPTSPSHV